MAIMLRSFALALTLVISGLARDLSAEEESPSRIAFESVQSAVFGGQKKTWTVAVTSPASPDLVLTWEYVANDRVIARGESPIENQNGKTQAELSLRIPAVKDGILLETRLAAALSRRGTVLAERRLPVWVFAENPFSQRQTWLEELQLQLFDPSGETVKVFALARIPARQIDSEELETFQEGILIVGEGISLKKNRGLGEKLQQAASQGARILWIAPLDGSMPSLFAGNETFIPPTNVSFRQHDVVTHFDKRLDCEMWKTTGSAPSEFQIVSRQSRVVLESAAEGPGWPWIDARFPNRGRWILCGFPLISTWNEGPTSRYFLARILETLDGETIADRR